MRWGRGSLPVVLLALLATAADATAANTPCSLPLAGRPGGLLVSDVAWPGELSDLLPGTEVLHDIKALATRLEFEGAPFVVVRMRGTDFSRGAHATDLAVVRRYVDGGGLLVVMGGTDTSWLLNDLFGWRLRQHRADRWWRALGADAPGADVWGATCFDMAENPVLEHEQESYHVEPTHISSLPPASHAIYKSGSDSYASVAGVGAGLVVWFAADWGGDTWNQGMLAALRMGSGAETRRAWDAKNTARYNLVFEGLPLLAFRSTVRSPSP